MTSALDVQVDGNHYKDKKIQPVEYIHANNLSFLEGCIVKRITRWKDKPDGGLKDLRKIQHEVDLIIELNGLEKPPVAEPPPVEEDWRARYARLQAGGVAFEMRESVHGLWVPGRHSFVLERHKYRVAPGQGYSDDGVWQ